MLLVKYVVAARAQFLCTLILRAHDSAFFPYYTFTAQVGINTSTDIRENLLFSKPRLA